MPAPEDVEFLPDIEDDSGADEDILPFSTVPRWIWIVATLAALGLVVAGVVTHRGDGHDARTAAQVSGQPDVPSSAPSPLAVVPGHAATVSPNDAVVSTIGRWVLRDGVLLALHGTRVASTVRVVPRNAGELTTRLVIDTAARRIWVVVASWQSRMVELDASTLHRIRDIRWAQAVEDAAALDGHLYLSTDRGVADLAPDSARPRFVAGLSGAVGRIAADPSRNRLVAIDRGFPTDVWTYRPGSLPVEAADTLPFSNGTLVIAHGAIWVGGETTSGPVLERLDPASMRPDAVSSTAARAGAGVELVAGGSRVLWLHGGRDDDALVCADAATGRVEQTWHIAGVGSVASSNDGTIVTTAGGYFALVLAACRG